MEKIFFFLISCWIVSVWCQNYSYNYIRNGGFESPPVAVFIVINQTNEAYPWEGFLEIRGGTYTIGFGQYAELEELENGNITQQVTLEFNGTYNLSFYRKAYSKNYQSYRLQVIWNNQLVLVVSPLEMDLVLESVLVYGREGKNWLTFREIGLIFLLSIGTLFDEVSLVLVEIDEQISNAGEAPANILDENNIEEEQCISIWCTLTPMSSIIFQIPINKIPVSRYLFLFLDDLWLYNYDKHQYRGTMKQILDFVLYLQNTKWQLITKIIPFNNIKQSLPISNYSEYTSSKILQIEQTDQNFFKILYPFYAYSIPTTAFLSVVLYLLFVLISRYSISIYLRKYFFVFGSMVQTLFENSMGYFMYIILCQVENLFSFCFVDKVFLGIGITFGFMVSFLAIGFYFLVGSLYQKQACYFIYCFYRLDTAYIYLTIRFLMRSILKGWVHYFLVNIYSYEMLSLFFIEVLVTFFTVYMQFRYKIWISKTFFCLYALYHGIFSLLNLLFAFELELLKYGTTESKSIHGLMQTAIIHSIILVVLLMMFIDFFPLPKNSSKVQQVSHQEPIQVTSKKPEKQNVLQNSSQQRKISKINPSIKKKVTICESLNDVFSANEDHTCKIGEYQKKQLEKICMVAKIKKTYFQNND